MTNYTREDEEIIKYPFPTMKIGDVKTLSGDPNNIRGARTYWQRKQGTYFKTRMTNKGLRIERIK